MFEGSRVGDVLASKYRLEELLGSGGMGHVYRAVNVEIERAVAIKVLRAEHATNALIVERFLREARAANLVRHPNVVDVVDVGRDADGSPFIVQELLTGEDFAKYVERQGGKLKLLEIGELLLPVIEAVAVAHARGVVHRDIKPENVFLAEQGRKRVPKLLDFGISKVRLPNIKATEVGMMMGTPAYMAPEQVQGSNDADPRTDVWALGVMLFELLAGHLPFNINDAPALFVAIATKDVPLLSDVNPEIPQSVARVVARCVRRNPDDRYPSALELARDLRHVLDGDEIEPTQKRSIPPLGALVPDLVPDLPLPPKRGVAAPTLSGPNTPLGLSKTELSLAQAPRSSARMPAAIPDLEPPRTASSARMAAVSPPSSQRAVAAAPPPPASQRAVAAAPPPSSQRLAVESVAESAGRIAPPAQAMMVHGNAPSPQRAAHHAHHQHKSTPAISASDMTSLISLGAVGLTASGVTVALMMFANRPDGWPILAILTKPTPTMSLVVQGSLAVVAFGLSARSAVDGVKKWRGVVGGGPVAALIAAALAGAFFFAALQLVRTAW